MENCKLRIGFPGEESFWTGLTRCEWVLMREDMVQNEEVKK